MDMPGMASLLQFFAAGGLDLLTQTGQDRAGPTEQTFVSTRREERGFEVDFDHAGPMIAGPARERSRRLNHRAGSDHQQGLAAIHGVTGRRQGVIREHLAEPHHGRPVKPATSLAGGAVSQFLAEFVDFLTATSASNRPYVTVEFYDLAASCLAV